MDTMLETLSVPAIAAVVYWVVNILKYTFKNNEKFLRFIPVLSLTLGVVCGLVCFFAIPNVIPATNVFVAMVIGGASGSTATGVNQIIKQATKDDKDEENEEDKK